MEKSAFTVLEVIVVVTILGVLLAIAIPNLNLSINRSYAKDALNNLLAIQLGQQGFKQHNTPTYNYYAGANIVDINTNLRLNISPNGGIAYTCSGVGANVCRATRVGNGAFRMDLTLTNPINASQGPVYCGTGNNPCCLTATAQTGACP